MGVSVVELVATALILVAVCVLGFLQLNAGETDASGGVAQYLWIPLFALILYRSLIASIFGISFERSMFWHGLFSLIATGYGIHHGIISSYFDNEEGKPGLDAFSGDDSAEYLSGAIASGLMLLTMMTSFAPIRRSMPRIWLWSHHVIPLAAAVVCAIHGAPVVLLAVGVYIADRFWGYMVQAHTQNRHSKGKANATVIGGADLVRVTTPRTFSFSPSQYVGLSVPSVSWLEWHNFTIASAPSDSALVIQIKLDGRWTRKLASKISELCGKGGVEVPLPVFIHGPLGSVSIDWTSERYTAFLLFGGRVGVTPVASFYRELFSQASRGRPVQMARLIYTTRSTGQALSVLELPSFSNPTRLEDDVEVAHTPVVDSVTPGFQTDVFITSEEGGVGTHAGGEASGFGAVAWHSGRPDLAAAFAVAAEEASASGIKRIAVLACGPEPMTDSVTKQARRASVEVKFDLHLEHFY